MLQDSPKPHPEPKPKPEPKPQPKPKPDPNPNPNPNPNQVSLSGGVDSMVLVHLLLHLRPWATQRYEVHALHVDYA